MPLPAYIALHSRIIDTDLTQVLTAGYAHDAELMNFLVLQKNALHEEGQKGGTTPGDNLSSIRLIKRMMNDLVRLMPSAWRRYALP